MSINENREFYVYEHVRLDNNTCFYVGKGKGERAYDLERNDHHNNISNKYGHAVVIIKDNLTEEEAFELERETIEDYVFNLGYGIDIIGFNNKEDYEIGHLTNCTWGGEGVSGIHHSEETKQKIGESSKGRHHSEETKQKIRESNKGKKLSDETKQRIGESHKGIQLSEECKKKISEACKGMQFSEEHKKNISKARKGIQLSEECKKKISKANKGKHHSEETKQKISKTNKGKHHSGKKLSEEHKLKISKSLKGENHPLYGKHLSEETKLKLSKKVVCVTTGEIFYSEKEASNYYKCSGISLCCEGIRKSAGKLPNGTKLQWKYVKNYNNDFKGILIKKEGIFNELKAMSENSHKKQKVICITTGKIFNTINAASNYYKCNNISACCRKKIQSAGKLSNGTPLKWKYLEDYNNDFKGILINPIADKID